MRLFSWHGLAFLAFAAGCGYVAGVGDRHTASAPSIPRIHSAEEEASPPPPPPGLAFGGATIEGVRLDDIDLTCEPHVSLPLFTQTCEPPIADATIHRATYEFPSGDENGTSAVPEMPYLDDCPNLDDGPHLEDMPHEALFVPYTLLGSATEIALGRFWAFNPQQLP